MNLLAPAGTGIGHSGQPHRLLILTTVGRQLFLYFRQSRTQACDIAMAEDGVDARKKR